MNRIIHKFLTKKPKPRTKVSHHPSYESLKGRIPFNRLTLVIR